MKFLFGFLTFLSSLVSAPDANGWVAVEKPARLTTFEHAGEEDDPNIWVIFSKQIGRENFMVRFPVDPQYRYVEGGIEVWAEKDGRVHRLRVTEKEAQLEGRAKEIASLPDATLIDMDQSGDRVNLLYRQEGKWVWEHLRETSHYVYAFQTQNPAFQGDEHRYFIQSLDVRSLS